MIRTFALVTVFAISLFAVPTKTTPTKATPATNILPVPDCNPCTNPWG